jgi:hypothetical protein
MDHENIFKMVIISIGIPCVAGIASGYGYDFYTENGGLASAAPQPRTLQMQDLSTPAWRRC